MISTIVLAAGVAVLLLLIAVGLIVVVLSDRNERRNIVVWIATVVLVLLLVLCCIGVVVGLVWFFFGATVLSPSPLVYPTSTQFASRRLRDVQSEVIDYSAKSCIFDPGTEQERHNGTKASSGHRR